MALDFDILEGLLEDEVTPDQGPAKETPPSAFAPVERGAVGDVGSLLARGTTRAIGLGGSALEAVGIPNDITEMAERARENFDFLKPDISEFRGEGFIKRGVKGGIESLPPSLAGALP